MTLNIVCLNQQEEYLQFLDVNLCEATETIETSGIRTLHLEYKFQDLSKEKELFRIGNKIWVQGDENLTDCLYVINTSVSEDIYGKNSIEVDLEEVLVELNYAPPFAQTELTSGNGFSLSTTNGKQEVTVDWNALNYWFGSYFNIGVVQKCVSDYVERIAVTGTINLMSLLRQIEEETGNVFVTRYEKDITTNIIHRYLDFLNPINVSKDWEFNLEYEFVENDTTLHIYDSNDSLTDDTFEDVNEKDDLVNVNINNTVANIDPTNTVFRFVNGDGILIDDDLTWSATDLGLTNNNQIAIISISKEHNTLAIDVGNKSYAVGTQENQTESKGNGIISISRDNDNKKNFILPDDSWFEFYDTDKDKAIFHTQINTMIGTVHEEILDFGYNLENITYEINETDTYHAIAPILTSSNEDNGLTRTQMNKLINDWLDLEVEKGETVPMIVQKVNVSTSTGTLAAAKTSLGTYNKGSNYFVRPYNPQDNTSSTTNADKTYEFQRATAYWKAPFNKAKGEIFVETENRTQTQYTDIYTRPDTRGERGIPVHTKMGNVETSDENIYSIFNDVCMKLKSTQDPLISVNVDVTNLQDDKYNNYQLHDKVYIKLPDSQELLTARVTKTTKEAHDPTQNTIEINNYTINTLKTIQKETVIDAEDMSYPYPTKPTLTIRLENVDHDPQDQWSIQYPANKLLTVTIFDSNGNPVNVYTKRTNTYGYVKIPLSLTPDNYDVSINFGGDEEFLDCSLTVNINCYGTLETVNTPERSSSSNSTSRSSTTTKTVKTYWNKCGLSPDKKKIVSIAQPSASVSDAQKQGVSMNTIYKTQFKNYCPECGKSGYLRFDGQKGTKCITSAGAHGRGYKKNIPECEITCVHCDSDFDGVTGLEKNTGHSTRLKRLTKPVKSSKSERAKLVKGQLVYGTKKVKVAKKSTNSKTRNNISSGINATVKKKALSIVKNKTGLAAAKEIAKWMGANIKYSGYSNFQRSPKTVLSKGSGNCCDQTRLMLQLMDAAGCRENLQLQYVHVCCNTSKYPGVGHVFAKITTKNSGKWRYVDPCKSSPWGHYVKGWGSPPGSVSNYSANSTPF